MFEFGKEAACRGPLHSGSHYEPVMVVGASRDQSQSCAASSSAFFSKRRAGGHAGEFIQHPLKQTQRGSALTLQDCQWAYRKKGTPSCSSEVTAGRSVSQTPDLKAPGLQVSHTAPTHVHQWDQFWVCLFFLHFQVAYFIIFTDTFSQTAD